MAFCTSCGATVTGAFCNQCGNPASATAAAAPPPPVPGAPVAPQAYPQAQMMPPAAARKTSPLVWILVALGGLFILFMIGILSMGAFFVHTAHRAGLDTDLMRRNPAAALARMAAIANKDVEILNEDDNAGTITMRDKKTGKTVTMSFDQMKNGVRISADGDNGKTAVMEFGGGTAKLPSWVPNYPGSTGQATFSVRGADGNGAGEGGNYTFTTSDSASQVMSFYQDKAKDLGLKVNVTTTTAQGGMIVASEEPSGRSLTIIVGTDNSKTTVNVTYADKK
jgi:hypothetical protein